MSGQFLSRLLGRLHVEWPVQWHAAYGSAAKAIGPAWRRLAGLDIVAILIRGADTIEAGIRSVSASLRPLFAFRALGFSAGLVWRGLAALTGIGLTASLVTALSAAGSSEPTLGALTIPPVIELRQVRDVLLAPRQQVLGAEDWQQIARPIAMFGLDAQELDRQPPLYEAMRSTDGTRRRDTLTFGDFDGDKAHLRLRLIVDHDGEQATQPFVITLVREAAQGGMSIQRSGIPASIATRFGQVETADVTVSDGGASRACIAFRKESGELPLGLSGWWCGSAQRPADRQQLTCLIDRIDLLAAADDKALRAAFSRSELKRQQACAPQRLPSSGGRKASWLDADGQPPVLRAVARR